jgi:hypothetical protein
MVILAMAAVVAGVLSLPRNSSNDHHPCLDTSGRALAIT